MNIALGADHRGFAMKQELTAWLLSEGYHVVDCGAETLSPEDDYPDFAIPVAQQVAQGSCERGIVVCGSGEGVTIAANKVKGIRAAALYSVDLARAAREHTDCHVAALSSDTTTMELAKEIVTTFLNTPFSNEDRHLRRIAKISQQELV
jgi:ribose 5-phosphate isomerase B